MRFLVLQDYKENRAKCTAVPLEGMRGVEIVQLPHPVRSSEPFELPPGVLLEVGAPALSPGDAALLGDGRIVVIDATWARVKKVLRRCSPPRSGRLERRSIPPGFSTAYPRSSKLYEDPPEGLATAEALFAASVVLGEPRPEFLQGYRWAEEFLRRSAEAVRRFWPAERGQLGSGKSGPKCTGFLDAWLVVCPGEGTDYRA